MYIFLSSHCGSNFNRMQLLICLVFLLVGSMAIKVHAANLTNIEFQQSPGIYFENLGPTHLYSSEWKLIIFYDLTTYKAEFNGFKVCLEQISSLCVTLKRVDPRNTNCDLLLKQFNLHLTEIADVNSLLLPPSNRIKRGLINGGGQILNSVFGLLDQDDASHYNTEIEKSRQNEGYLLQLAHNQTLVADATANVMKRTIEDVDHQFYIFNQHLKRIDTDLNYDKLKLTMTEDLQTLTTYSILLLMRYQDTQTTLRNMFSSLYLKKLNPSIISPTALSSQLQIIRSNLPKHLSLPAINNKVDPNLIYQLSYTQASMVDDRIIFEARIPLISAENFQLFHLHPIPTLINNEYRSVQPTTDFLLVDFLRDHFSSISSTDIEACVVTPASERMCKQTKPLMNRRSTVYSCELDLLDHPDSLPPSCKISSSEPTKYFLRLSDNRQLYSVEKKYTTDLICNSIITHHILQKSGILTIPPGCYLRVDSLILYPDLYSSSSVHQSYVPSINLTSLHIPENSIQPTMSESTSSPKKDLDDLVQSIKNQANASSSFPTYNTLSKHDVHHYVLLYIMIAVVIIIICILCLKFGKFPKLCKIKSSYKPQIRQAAQENLDSIYSSIDIQEKPNDETNQKSNTKPTGISII